MVTQLSESIRSSTGCRLTESSTSDFSDKSFTLYGMKQLLAQRLAARCPHSGRKLISSALRTSLIAYVLGPNQVQTDQVTDGRLPIGCNPRHVKQ